MTMTPVAATIVAQMGGPKIFAMAFKRAVCDENSITFEVAPGLKRGAKCTHVRVTLMPSDTYRVEFLKVGKFDVTPVKFGVYDDVYCDTLKSLVEEKTGLYLSL